MAVPHQEHCPPFVQGGATPGQGTARAPCGHSHKPCPCPSGGTGGLCPIFSQDESMAQIFGKNSNYDAKIEAVPNLLKS